MSNKRKHFNVWIPLTLLSLVGSPGCDVIFGKACTPNAEHKAQPGCLCPCNNNQFAEECLDSNNWCCYHEYGACQSESTMTPNADSDQAAAMAPPNKVTVAASMQICEEDGEYGTCTIAYPLVPCEKYYAQVLYFNYGDTHVDASFGNINPQFVILPVGPLSYGFSYPPKDVPWPALDHGEHETIGVEIQTRGSAGNEVEGLDPGAQQCDGFASFSISLQNVGELTGDGGMLTAGVVVNGSTEQPYGACQPGEGC